MSKVGVDAAVEAGAEAEASRSRTQTVVAVATTSSRVPTSNKQTANLYYLHQSWYIIIMNECAFIELYFKIIAQVCYDCFPLPLPKVDCIFARLNKLNWQYILLKNLEFELKPAHFQLVTRNYSNQLEKKKRFTRFSFLVDFS